jgi:gliding motility-associated-like protein
MNKFNEIIKQKAEQFEVPFNEAHWAEMDGKLNKIRATKIKNTILGTAAAFAIIATAGYFAFFENEKVKPNNNTLAVNSFTEQITKEDNINNKKIIVSTPERKHKAIKAQVEQSLVVADVKLNTIKQDIKTIEVSSFPNQKDLIENTTPANKKIDLKANAEFIVYNNQVCLGEEVNFESQTNEQPLFYTWNFGDGTISHEKNPSHRYKDSRTYSVSLSLLNRQTGVETTSIQNNVVTIVPNPKANFSFLETSINHDDNKLKYPYTTFTIVEINEECTYEWSYGNGKSAIGHSGKVIYKKRGDFTSSLIVKNNNTGCKSTHKKKVLIKNGFDLFAPNAFTPNNNGGNETFIPKALLGWNTKFEMVILDKSGKTLFKTSEKNEPWNGKVNNSGQILPDGIYLWKVITYDAENNAHRHHGKITLVK